LKQLIGILTLLLVYLGCSAQFAPQAALTGSTAIHKDSSILVEWASDCKIHRGWLDIADTTLGKVSSGDSSRALGMADADIVSLGDGGEAVLYFSNPITNGNGPDFAIFENGFRNPADSNEAFLELATVEVSNNGINYFPFIAQCHNDTVQQIAGAGMYMDARKVHNLAGKYVTYFGTPFDLDELSMILSLDVNNIQYIKIKDVIGSLAVPFCTRDDHDRMINDPYPTPFATGGFDLDAVAVIHHKFPTAVQNTTDMQEDFFYPNPATTSIYFKNAQCRKYRILSAEGKLLSEGNASTTINIGFLSKGLYLLQLYKPDGSMTVQRLNKL
jgi:hypothetical protein